MQRAGSQGLDPDGRVRTLPRGVALGILNVKEIIGIGRGRRRSEKAQEGIPIVRCQDGGSVAPARRGPDMEKKNGARGVGAPVVGVAGNRALIPVNAGQPLHEVRDDLKGIPVGGLVPVEGGRVVGKGKNEIVEVAAGDGMKMGRAGKKG